MLWDLVCFLGLGFHFGRRFTSWAFVYHREQQCLTGTLFLHFVVVFVFFRSSIPVLLTHKLF